MRFALFLLSLGLLPATALAEEVCLARATSLVPASAGGQPIGELSGGRCYAVQDRVDGSTRIYVSGPKGFRGEADVPNAALLQILVDDVDIEYGDQVWGKVLSGTPVAIEQTLADGRLVVQPIEGRLRPRMTVEATGIFPAQNWPEPDPDDVADPPWPEASFPLPPTATAVTTRAGAGDVVAEIGPPTMAVADLQQDRALGQLRWAFVEQTEREAKIRIVAPTMWVEGWTTSLDWREAPPEAGYDPAKGAPAPTGTATPPRQVANKDANLSLQAKGDPVGQLGAGTRVTVLSEEKGWAKVQAQGPGSVAEGWMDRRKLLKEGAEDAISVTIAPIAVVKVGNTAVSWANAEGHSRPVEEGEEPDEDDLVLVVDPVRGRLLQDVAAYRLAYGAELASNGGKSGEITVRTRVDQDGAIVEAVLAVDTLGIASVSEGLLASLQELEEEAPLGPRPRLERRPVGAAAVLADALKRRPLKRRRAPRPGRRWSARPSCSGGRPPAGSRARPPSP
jgi:hypothetical protein